ncbi:nudix (nucleoside diphosphate linked moiety X)-type motif 2 [Nowakowskiella sp. JEL0407]|nr:nudix (nucleoside diphosphate linked moiety X)-type motif 2 [Nowakowskiella sp. JEL0407]
MELSAGLILYRIQRIPEFLLINDSLNSSKRHWSPPKGRVIGNEDELRCAIRETIDITGLSPKDISVESKDSFRVEIKYLANNSRPKKVVLFLAQVSSHGRIIPSGLAGLHFAWLPLQQAQDKALYKSMQDILKQAYNHIQSKRATPPQSVRNVRDGATSLENGMGKLHIQSDSRNRGGMNLDQSEDDRRETVDKGDYSPELKNAERDFRTDSEPETRNRWKKVDPVNAKEKEPPTSQSKDFFNVRESDKDSNKQGQVVKGEKQLYKTRLCERFETDGHCPYENRCHFAHGTKELRDRPNFGKEPEKTDAEKQLYKTRLCERFMKDNFCQYGPRCNFAHSLNELRDRPVFAKECNGTDAEQEKPRIDYSKNGKPQPTPKRSWVKQAPAIEVQEVVETEEEIVPKKIIASLPLPTPKQSKSRGSSPDEKSKKDVVSLHELMSGKDGAKNNVGDKVAMIEEIVTKELKDFFYTQEGGVEKCIERKVSEEVKEITRWEFKYDLKKLQVFNILVRTFMDEIARDGDKALKNRSELLKKFITTSNDQLKLLQAFSKQVQLSKLAKRHISMIYKSCYDLDLVEEDVMMKWYDMDGDESVKKCVLPLIEWLKTAEEEE